MIDRWCSGPDWVLPAQAAFSTHSDLLIVDCPGGIAGLARYHLDDGRTAIAGLEPMWGFACPLIGPDVVAVAEAVHERLRDEDWTRLLLPGFPEDLDLARAIAGPLSRFGNVMAGPGISRQVADITDADRWWTRRSARFRRNLRRAEERATRTGLEFVDLSADLTTTEAPDLVERLVEIETRSWKARPGDGEAPTGLTDPSMQTFYLQMIRRLTSRGRCRAVIATLEGIDVGYILGGVRNRQYRGLQLGYTTDVAELSVGHLLQLREIRHLSVGGLARTYDLGMDMEYKRAWADRLIGSVTVTLDRR